MALSDKTNLSRAGGTVRRN